MKTLVIIPSLALVLLSSCASQKLGTATYNDDVYANPKEDRIEDARLAAVRKQAQDAVDKRYNDSIAAVKQAQKEKDDANPYYKDREFKYDDYYDYEYATRVKRFDNRINGLSYYDNYYTNSYFYNQNPYNYGVSVYNGYSWWGSSYNNYSYNPSVNFYSSWGWGYGNQFNNCYSGYNPYMAGYSQGYNNGFYNGMYGNYYGYGNPYGYGGYGASFGYGSYYGYGNSYGYGGYGYNNPYNNGWGYYNGYDNNSSYSYGPRSSHGGGNSRRSSNPGITEIGKRESLSDKYISQIAEKQIRGVKLTETPVRGTSNTPIRVDNNGNPIRTINTTSGVKQDGVENTAPVKTTPIRGGVIKDANFDDQPTRNIQTAPVRSVESNIPIRNDEPVRNNQPIRENAPVKQTQIETPRFETPVRQNPNINTAPVRQIETPRFETPVRQNQMQTPSAPNNNGGGNVPNNGGGGGHRPR